MHQRLIRVCCAVMAAACTGVSPAAAAGSVDVPLPGGTAALARALGIDPAPEPARALVEFARVVHELPKGSNPESDARLERLALHVAALTEFQAALATVQPRDGGIALTMAASKTDRNRLKDFLDFVGLRLREKKKVFTVEPTRSKEAAERVRLLANVGVTLDALAARLNNGEAVRIEIPAELVPVPMSAALWGSAIWGRPLTDGELVSAILADRQAAFLAQGLMGVSRDTLTFMTTHPGLLKEIYDGPAAAFATFGPSLSVRDGRIVTPGGTDAVALWERAVDEKVTAPERFVKALLQKNGGRLAYVYDTVANLDLPHQRFALGAWIEDRKVRQERFAALVDVMQSSVSEWEIERRPFFRPPFDAALALVRTVDGLNPAGATALYDVILHSLDLLGRQAGRKALVVFTDGEDQGSSAPLQTVQEQLRASDVTLYMVGQGKALESEALRKGMQQLVAPTGGRALFTAKVDDLNEPFTEIRDELSNQYVLGYASTNARTDGTWRKLKVQLNTRGQVRAREGYRAPGP